MFTKKRIIIITICLLVFTFLITSVSFRCSFDRRAGMGVSVAFFEKWKMWSIDRIVIETDTGKEVEITDSVMVDKIIDETAIATHGISSKHGHYERWIYLYDGDELVRSMKWSTCDDMVELYEEDACHWLFAVEGEGNIGRVYLSEELVDKLEQLIDKA